MSDHGTPQDHHDGPHEGPIKTPKQLILAVLFSFVVPVVVIVLLVMYVVSHDRPAAGSDAFTPESVAKRIHPVGAVQVKDATDVASLKSGEQVFGAQCSSCHAAGLVGAPKPGDAAAWAPRIATGYAALLKSALGGKGSMGAQSGGDFTDFEIGRAVAYMANQSGAKFDEPKAPAAAAAAASAAAAPTAQAPSTATTAVAAATLAAAAVAATAPVADAGNGAVPALYTQVCQVCHVAGVANAPKLGDKAAWAPRLALGIDGLTASVVTGKGAMPPKGGSAASDAEIKTVVTYMVNASK